MADPSYIDDDGVLVDPEAWVAIATTTLSSDAASITFTSPADGSSTDWSQFMDLVFISYIRGAVASSDKQYNMHSRPVNVLQLISAVVSSKAF